MPNLRVELPFRFRRPRLLVMGRGERCAIADFISMPLGQQCSWPVVPFETLSGPFRGKRGQYPSRGTGMF